MSYDSKNELFEFIEKSGIKNYSIILFFLIDVFTYLEKSGLIKQKGIYQKLNYYSVLIPIIDDLKLIGMSEMSIKRCFGIYWSNKSQEEKKDIIASLAYSAMRKGIPVPKVAVELSSILYDVVGLSKSTTHRFIDDIFKDKSQAGKRLGKKKNKEIIK